MFIVGIRLTNWEAYKGVHEIALKPLVYSVVGRKNGDDSKSNWAGKSSLGRALRWCITGLHSKQTLDDLITHGETEMAVEIQYDTGLFVARSKAIGASTTIEVQTPDDQTLRGSGAEEHISKHVVSIDEYDTVNYVEQGKAAEVVKAGGASMIELMTNWFKLDKVEDAITYADNDRKRLEAKIKETNTLFPESSFPIVTTLEQLEEQLEKAEQYLEDCQAALDEQYDFKALASVWDSKNEAYLKYEANLTALKLAEATARPDYVEDTHKYVIENLATTKAKREATTERIRQIADVDFDGNCPVTCKSCPVATEVREHLATASELLESTKQERQKHSKKIESLEAALQWHVRVQKQAAAYDTNLDTLRGATKDAPTKPSDERPEYDIDEHAKLTNQARTNFNHIASLIKSREDNEKESKRLTKVLEELKEELGEVQECLRILKEARTTLLEGGMGLILNNANAVLSGMDIDLTIGMRWYREGQELASECECGFCFPKSVKVKVCETCGKAREKKKKFEPKLTLNHESGGALDVAGLAFRIGAADFIRHERGTALTTMVIDEPFGDLDTYNSKSAGRHVMNMIRDPRFSFEQALIIAHDSSLLDSAQGRIVIDSVDDLVASVTVLD